MAIGWPKIRGRWWGRACGGALGALLTTAAGAGLAQAPQTASPPTAAAPAEGVIIEQAPADGGDGAAGGSVFAKVPPIPQVLPRPGVFFMPPQGPGYYSLW